DTQIAAIQAAVTLEEEFALEGPGLEAVKASLGRKAQLYKGSVQLSDRKKPLRHLIAISEGFLSLSTAANSSRTLVIDSSAEVLWSMLARLQGLPAVPEWAQWFCREMEKHNAVMPILGIGCRPVIARGNKLQFLKWLRDGVRRGAIPF